MTEIKGENLPNNSRICFPTMSESSSYEDLHGVRMWDLKKKKEANSHFDLDLMQIEQCINIIHQHGYQRHFQNIITPCTTTSINILLITIKQTRVRFTR